MTAGVLDRRVGWTLLAGWALAVVLLRVGTVHGIGVEPDSAQYMSAAGYFLRGEGLRVHWWDAGTAPLTHFPPGLALALAALQWMGLAVEDAAWVLNGASLLASVLLASSLAARAAPRSAIAGVLGGTAVLLSRDVLVVHSMIMSEPLFLALNLGALLATVRAIEEDDMRMAVVAGIVAGMAVLTRYVAPTTIGTSVLALALFGKAPLSMRLRRSLLAASLAAVPVVLVLVRNSLVGGSATDREVALHPIGGEQLRSAIRTAYYWVVPSGAPAWVELAALLSVGFGLAWFIIGWLRSPAQPAPSRIPVARLVLGLFVAAYAGFLALSLTFVDAQSTPDARMLVPMVPPLAILTAVFVADAAADVARRPSAIAFGSTLALSATIAVGTWITSVRQSGLGYSTPGWRESRLIARVRELPADAMVFSNHPMAIWYHAGREVLGVPRLYNPNTMRPMADYEERMASVCQQVRTRVFVANFTSEAAEPFLPTLSQIRRHWHSRPIFVAPDGVLDEVPVGCVPVSPGKPT